MTSLTLIIVLSIIASAFFSGMEIAYFTSNKLYIELEKKEGGFVGILLEKLTKNPSKFITTMLVGNNIALVIYGFYMGNLLMTLLTPFGIKDFFMFLIQTIISTLIILVTAEFLPKAIFRVYANETLKYFALPAYLFYLLLSVISQFIMLLSNFLLKFFFKIKPDEAHLAFSKAELGHFLNEQLESVNEAKEIDSEIQIFQNALEFQNVRAREVMIPRTEIIAVDVSDSINTIKKEFIETGLSKILVYKNNLDEIIGYVHSFELFKNPKSIRSILLPVEFVPETMMINVAMDILIKKRKSIAIVLDEYGGTSGIITVEDIIEELFGEIEDEHDSSELLEVKINDHEFNFSARLEVDYLIETYNLELPEDEAYETLGGLIVYHTEKIPVKGEIIELAPFQFTILKVSHTKIEEIHLKVLSQEK
ncbi:MAG: hemolysin [Flavobacteriales bacterium CG03_land_8_20_14_0_80_35_15]|nr:HlyC/CorC family transporter [Zetaproteobacteria bacterium]PIV17255.1 MAG: hemolysin [Flavobacteriales bacterium CG03_land_8_20_14_0_80_35_15]PIX07678.1 MAG: hemolysin [Flavobacteriales bacterium CG_4_8_14_3_um_filter_35_10]PJA06019.1 MAG: hemolysin [Flavobacteriales bacterium CG_4_10_14_0_2_um_filter_35_18]